MLLVSVIVKGVWLLTVIVRLLILVRLLIIILLFLSIVDVLLLCCCVVLVILIIIIFVFLDELLGLNFLGQLFQFVAIYVLGRLVINVKSSHSFD